MKDKKIKALPKCICGHDNSEHLRDSESGIYHCKEYGCKCDKWQWDKKVRYLKEEIKGDVKWTNTIQQ